MNGLGEVRGRQWCLFSKGRETASINEHTQSKENYDRLVLFFTNYMIEPSFHEM